MEMERAMHLRLEWGGKPCDHPHVVIETHCGAKTGDRVCTQCGKEFVPDEDVKPANQIDEGLPNSN